MRIEANVVEKMLFSAGVTARVQQVSYEGPVWDYKILAWINGETVEATYPNWYGTWNIVDDFLTIYCQ